MNLFEALKEELLLPLPGMEAQLIMAPRNRISDSRSKKKLNAGVAILICPTVKNSLELTFIKRSEYEGHHSGQVSFPGGKEEPGDNSLMETAKRETLEEIGIQLTSDHFAGSLTPLFIPISCFMVYPYVFIRHEVQNFVVDPAEVEYIIQYPLLNLLNKSIIGTTKRYAGKHAINTPYFAIHKEIVWGATAMILSEFIELVRRVERKNPGLLRSGYL
jgi:8-oxo-dGTP pyrophosphatase MutT (NUDIX family)